MTEVLYADCCPQAPAVHMFSKDDGALAFCGHHGRSYGLSLISAGWAEVPLDYEPLKVMTEIEATWRV